MRSGRFACPEYEQPRLLFGIPKKGRLFEKVSKVLAGAGIEYTRQARLDIAHCRDLPLSLVFLPAADIPTYVGEGDMDLGITGEDMVAECEVDVDVVMKLGFGKCNLSVQGPKNLNLKPEDLAGKRIVTSFPAVTRKYFEQFEQPGNPTQIKCISGSVEAAIGLGLADGIVDLVETGTTMRAAGLEEVSVVSKSQAVLIANPDTKHRELVDIIKKRLEGYLVAQSWVMVSYNVHRKNLKEAEALTPGSRSPSIQALQEPNWVAVTALVQKQKAADTMDALAVAGAKDIILTDVFSTRLGD